MQTLSMIDMGAKVPEIVAPAKSAEPQGKHFGKMLGEQRRPEKAQQPEAKQQPAEKQTVDEPVKAEQPAAQKADVSQTAKAAEQSPQQPQAEQPVTEKQNHVSAEVVAEVEPKLQQIVMNLMKAIAGGETSEMSEETGSIEELLTQMVQQLEGTELNGEQVLAGIDLTALIDQLQQITAEGGEEQLQQLVVQLEQQLADEEGLLANAELAAAMLPTDDPQAATPNLVENLAQARQILQKAIDGVAAQKAPDVVTEEAVAVEEIVVEADAEATGQDLLLDQEAVEEIDPRFAGLLKPRSENRPQHQQSLRQQVQGNNAEKNQGQMKQAGETVQQMPEMKVEQNTGAEFAEQLVNNPKQAFENLVQQAQAQPNAAAQAQSMSGKPMAETPMVQLPSGQQVAESQIFDQVVARFTGSFNGESGRMVLRMQPAELGSLKLELMVEGDRIRANIHAQSQQVQEVLERNLPQLRNALAEQGLKIDQFQVDVNRDQSQQNQFDQLAQQQQQQRQGSHAQPGRRQFWEPEEQIVPLAHLMQNGGGGISLHV